MADARITPEKITHPLQLMAAWFVMLIALVASLLTAAAKIDHPPWAAGFLVISAVVLALLVMGAVFVMLTTFRPHLQGPKEYADWLKDERRFKGEVVQEVQVREIRRQRIEGRQVPDTAVAVEGRASVMETATYLVQVSGIDGADKLLTALKRRGFTAELYQDSEGGKVAEHTAIWVGARVPGAVAVLAMKTAVDVWPHLRYVHLSSDTVSGPPDDVHDQLYLGGSTATAERYGLKPWTVQQIKELPDEVGMDGLHRLIRAKYR